MVFDYSAYGVNEQDKKMYFLFGNQILTFDADKMMIEKHQDFDADGVSDMQYDPVSKSLFCIVQTDNNYVKQIDMSDMSVKTIMTFNATYSFVVGGATFDWKRGVYYLTGSDEDGNNLIVGCNVNSRQVSVTNLKSGEMDGICYDEVTDSLVGFYSTNSSSSAVFSSLDVSGKLNTWKTPVPSGIIGLYSNSVYKGFYFYQVINNGVYTFGALNLKTQTVDSSFTIYDNFIYGHFFGSK